MKTLVFMVSLMALSISALGQTDSVVLKKESLRTFRCQNENALNWYIFSENNSDFILVNLDIPEKEVKDWFISKRNSQNLYRSQVLLDDQGKEILLFQRGNNVEDQIRFEIINKDSTSMQLYIEVFEESYYFQCLDL